MSKSAWVMMLSAWGVVSYFTLKFFLMAMRLQKQKSAQKPHNS